MKIQYVVSVKQVVDTAQPGEEPKVTETVLADFTGGPNAASAVLTSMAESVLKGKKIVGIAAVLQSLNAQMEKAKKDGKPTIFDELGKLFDTKSDTTTR